MKSAGLFYVMNSSDFTLTNKYEELVLRLIWARLNKKGDLEF